MKILEIKNLSLNRDNIEILKNLNLEFEKGLIYAIVGVNGAGKSTLANTIMGCDRYKDFLGDIIFEKESIKEKNLSERARLGITLGWQEPVRFEGLKVKDFLLASSEKKDFKLIKESLKLVGLNPEEYILRTIDNSLSGGERKKIELASILAMNPKIAFLDEPDSGIDIESIEKIHGVIKKLKERGTTVVLITHSMSILEHADYGFLICKGELIKQGNSKEISEYFQKECMLCKNKNPGEKK